MHGNSCALPATITPTDQGFTISGVEPALLRRIAQHALGAEWIDTWQTHHQPCRCGTKIAT
eukprot:10170078-Prorocentrum_lima.AAC.1